MTPGVVGAASQGLQSLQSQSVGQSASQTGTQGAGSSPAGGFASALGSAIDQVDALSNQADQMAASYAAGGPVTVDQLMVAEQQASLAVDLVVQVRDRAVSAYQTIMNMQI
ncbi:flagellar hook-basal body complex protein FliE [Alicyclobacillus cycloheptanicus]|jgi:flagellar hook-basal body complex protein FliE|uniref:Flagellar hook-basal body complex protein FliE n=1 Tax=Alicyclobacillus cycloheptanicus TaxID=1457 RepID=A0ABT9XK24_9BACL|nr:flagellar hook-basal body complex protein FliE [Alicyclobacillus cycloheptanicus]MDQ0190562.1 flagellar hook-basal body complex protein FliE [Alicyclobacillus cycloheptanicus]WDM01403.1 flagellar hook-basal body complex protein FliE [Alicyclobacillus cycloheptanicus]